MSNYSTQYIAVAVIVLTQAAKAAGVEVSSEQLTDFVSLLLTLLSGAWILVERFKKGGINWLGMKK